jgi:hypothetical protein
MNTLGNPKITPELKQKIVDGVLEEAGNRSVQQLAKEENEMLLRLINLRTKDAAESTSAKKDGQT